MSDELSSPETADLVRAYLAEHPVASQRDIAAALGIGRSTAGRAVRRLMQEERIARERLGTGAGYPSRYDGAPPPEQLPGEESPRRRTRRGRRARRPRSGGAA